MRMGNQLTDLMDEVDRLKKQDPSLAAPSRETPKAEEEAPVQPPTTQQQPSTPQVDPGPPRLQGVDLEHGGVVCSIGNFPLDEKELKEIVTICLRALARSLRNTFAMVATTHGVEAPKRTGLTVMATELPRVDGNAEIS
jgi:hypothetical protein